MKSNLLVKALIGAITLTLLTMMFTEIMGSPHNISYYLWSIPANFLVSLVLGYYIIHSTSKGFKLCANVLIVYFIIGFLNIMIEALIFNVSDQVETVNSLIGGLFLTLLYSPLYVYVLGKWESKSTSISFQPRSIFSWIWKITITDLLYFVVYMLAGLTLIAVYPELIDFYEDKVPAFDLIFKTQLFRGLIFAGIALLVLRTTDLPPLKAALLIGAIFSVLGGIAPLIPPNELMPPNIRLAHGFEVGVSNFIYGIIVGYLLKQKIAEEVSPPSVSKG
ncbi:MAG: hypothetical protein E2O88_01620 [Bacteroidetes bacterium]|nr:MAG: hypothetical protein E2O88_01620 [Bacteroidota bacterium]